MLPEVKTVCGEGHVLVVHFPLNVIQMAQPVNVGYRRLLRCEIRRELDDWLMDEANLLKCEDKISEMERRVSVAHLVVLIRE